MPPPRRTSALSARATSRSRAVRSAASTSRARATSAAPDCRLRTPLTMNVEGVRMRTFLSALSATLVLSAPAAAATRNFGITDYTKVRVEGPYKVTLATGVPPFARASGSATALDRIEIETRGDTLVVRADPNAWGGYPGQDPGPVEVVIGTHDLTSAALTGAGSLAI